MRARRLACLVLPLLLACSDDASDDGGGGTGAGDPTGPMTGAGSTSGNGPSATASGTSGAGGTPSSDGFTPDEGFTVSGRLSHGSEVTISRTGGGFGSRAEAAPWLWDHVDVQYLAGEELHAYMGIGDGEPIVDSVWTDLGIYSGWDTPEHRFKLTTSAPLRHARATAQYGNYAASPSDPKPYSKLARPAWPAAFGPQDNAQMYLSWWQRVSGDSPGYPEDGNGNGGEDKPLRFGDTNGAGLGEFDITVAGLTATTEAFGNVKSWGSLEDPGDEWHRIEFFVDRAQGIADLYVDGKLGIGTYSGVGGDFEFRPEDAYLFVQPAIEGTQLATSSWENVTVHWLGFDDGGSTQMFAPGRNVEIGEVYVDVTRARVEIASAETWEHAPDADRTSEVQGRLLAWSDTEIRFDLNAGAFDDLEGLYLWVITEDGAAVRIGRFGTGG